MKIKECFIKGKSPNPDLCEDELIISDNFVVVLDGVTSKSEHLWNGVASGKMAVEVIKDALRQIEENVSAMDFFSRLSFALRQRYHLEFEKDISDEKLRCAVIAYSDYAHEVWSYGDCQCMINGKLYRHEKKLDKECALIRSSILKKELEAGKSIEKLLVQDIGRKKLYQN